MQKFRTSFQLMTERLDVNYYQPIFIENQQKIESAVTKEFKHLYQTNGIGHTASIEPHYSKNGHGIPYISGKVLKSNQILIDIAERIKLKSHQEIMSKSKLKPGYLLIVRKGDVGNACIISQDMGELNCSSEIMFFELSSNEDPYYLVSFFNSYHGSLATKRLQRGSLIPGVSLLDIPNLKIFYPDRAVQNYIGDKVRLAEKLRERSKQLEQQGKEEFNTYFGSFKPIPFRKHYRTSISQLDNRIDTWFYNPRFLWAVQAIKDAQAKLTPLGEIATQITNGGTPRNACFGSKGIRWIRGKDFEHGDIENIDSLPLLDFASEQTIKRSRLKVGDIILSIKGTVGDVAVVDELLEGCNTNQDVAKIEIGNLEDANFIASFLESELGKVLIEQQVYGAVNAFFSLENLRLFGVPEPSSVKAEFKSKVSGLRYKSILYKRLSQVLTTAAKYLVEALIEGKLTETELKNAQTALQKGDIEPDKAILAKLTRQGYDIPDKTALFPDLDALYEATKEINLTSDS